MPATAPYPTRTAHPVIQRFFDTSLYFLLFTGFALLAGTGKLDVLSLLVGLSALLGRGYLLLRKSAFNIPEQWTSYLTLAYVIFFAIDYFVISQAFIGALVHMVLFAAIIKIFSLHQERDYVYLAVLSFGMVLAASVLTVDSLFFVMFCAFVLLAVMTFVSMEMRRSWIKAQPQVPSDVRDLRDLKRLPGAVSRVCAWLLVSIVLGTIAFFFLIPRKASAGYLGGLNARSDLSMGFSEEVQLGQIGQIQQSSALMMHVKFDQATIVPQDLRWRGVALTTFDGRRWSAARESGQLYPVTASWASDLTGTRLFAGHGSKVSYTVSLEPFGSRVFFVLPQVLAINGRYRAIRVDSTASIFNADNSHAITDYSAQSEISPAMSAAFGAGGDHDVSEIIYLQLPAGIDPRIAQLARRVTLNQATAFGKAFSIERYLSSSYGYTLQLPAAAPKDPLANFLFQRKQGHCEYFASAMVVMLRTVGIPARIVNGFRGGEYNDLTGSYIVRARDAHSWVEAYFPDYGWYTFDPTPSSPPLATSSWNRVYLYFDAMREFWHDWVVSYDTSHQSLLGIVAVRQSRFTLERMRSALETAYRNSVRRANDVRAHVNRHLQLWTLATGAGVSLVLLFLTAPKLFRAFRRMQFVRRPSLAPQAAATVWYARLLKLLARRGIRKPLSHTAQEFLNTIPSLSIRERVESFTICYERARFGDSAEDAEKLPEIYAEIEAVNGK